jgi:hypothetical protein
MTEDNIKMECTVKMLSVYESFQCRDLVAMLMCVQIPEGLVIFVHQLKEGWENSGVELQCPTSPTEKVCMHACCMHNIELLFVGESSEMAGEWGD